MTEEHRRYIRFLTKKKTFAALRSGFDKVGKILDIPGEIKIVGLLTIGYPQQPLTEKLKSRLDMKEIIRWEKWS